MLCAIKGLTTNFSIGSL